MSPEEAAPPRRRLLTSPLAAALLLAAHFGMAVSSSRHDSCTFDEIVFLTGGISHWVTGDYRLAPDGGALAQRWAALPVVAAGVNFPPLDDPAWIRSDAWVLGKKLLYETGNDRDRILLLARSQIALLSVMLGALVWLWSRSLFGAAGGTISLVLYAFSPAFLAHGRLVTADVSAALLLLAATWACWRAMGRVATGTVATSCIATALLFLAKASAILILPVALVMLVARLVSQRALVVALGRERLVNGPLGKVGALIPVLVLHVAVTVFAIWAAFAFRYPAFDDFEPGRDILREGGWEALADPGWCERPVAFAREHRLLPEGWLFGLQYVLKHSNERRAYALGRYSMTGWWWYFPIATLLKTPLSALALGAAALASLAAALARASRTRRGGRPRDIADGGDGETAWPAGLPGRAASDLLELVPLAALLVVYGAASLAANLNIGMRHILPMLPPMIVLCGAVAWILPLQRRATLAVSVLLVLGVGDALLSHPRYIGYFNAFGGSPAARWRLLVDSSLDWGQGLKELRTTLATRRAPGDTSPVYLAYFGSVAPRAEGLDVEYLPGFVAAVEPARGDALQPGLYCISATVLVQVYSNFPGTWAVPFEEAWQRASPLVAPWLAGDPATRAALRREHGDAYWNGLLLSYEQLRIARLCAWLRHREADIAVDGGSILAWQLTAQDLDAALAGPPAELRATPVDIPWAGRR